MPDSPAHHVRRWREAVGQPDVAAEDLAQHVTQNGRALPAIAQEMADLVWVVYGAAELLGIDLDRALSEVAAANMRKLAGGVRRRADGKILKPDGWVGPDMARCISDMRALGRGGVKP